MAVTVTVMEVGECEEHLAAIVRERLGTKLRVLDAGCGRMWNWDLGDVDMHLTGIDEDAEALRLRVEVKKDLDEAIVGDLRTVPLDDEAYDLVHSAYVLEHVSGAELVLDRMLAALRPGGLMVIKVPDGDSVYGWITRMTPHWVHVKYKRWIRRKKLAGTPGHGPYPSSTTMSSAAEASPSGASVTVSSSSTCPARTATSSSSDRSSASPTSACVPLPPCRSGG